MSAFPHWFDRDRSKSCLKGRKIFLGPHKSLLQGLKRVKPDLIPALSLKKQPLD